ncbi:alpha/beta-hydrolase [Atractiella rhizophila]|nr:alpha/beta-hydrolase [Atractiella rhizophila]
MPRRENTSSSRHSKRLSRTLPQHIDSVVSLADSLALLQNESGLEGSQGYREGHATMEDAMREYCRAGLKTHWDMEEKAKRKVMWSGFLIRAGFDILCSSLYIFPFRDMIKISIDTGDTGKCNCLVWLPNKKKLLERIENGTSAYGLDGKGKRGIVMSLHGGGWTICRPHVDYTLCRHMADELETVVIAPDYRKAPRYPYPHAIFQLHAVLQWLSSGALLPHLPPAIRPLITSQRISLLGNSAGSNLCASLTVLSILQPLPFGAKIVSCSLLYPVLNLSIPYGDKLSMMVASKEGLPSWMSLLFLRCYVPPPRLTTDLALSPALAPNVVLEKFPPTVVCSAQRDYLAKEADDFSDRLKDLGVKVRHRNFEQVGHAFDAKPELWSKRQREINNKARVEAWKMISDVMVDALAEEKEVEEANEVMLHRAVESAQRDTDSTRSNDILKK